MRHRQHAEDGGGADDPIRVTVDAVRGVPVVRVAGEIDLLTVDRFRGAITQALRLVGADGTERLSPVVVDLSGVAFFSSVGAAVLVEAIQSGRVAGVPVRVVAREGSTVYRSLDMMGILATTGSYPTVDAALVGLTSAG